MSMERFQRIAQLWNWLPGFRGVAEHESIHKAAVALGVSPSALSRTVKLLEDNLGAPLFTRHATGLRLTPLGSELLSQTRAAMRLIDDGIEGEHGPDPLRPIRVGVTSGLTAIVAARALAGAVRAGTRIDVAQVEGDVGAQLMQGNLDAVITAVAMASAELTCEPVGVARAGIYASPLHPLAAQAGRLGDDALATADFVVAMAESWATTPPPGAVVATCETLEVARALCESTALLAVLPDAAFAAPPSLVRLADAPSTPLFFVRRRPVAGAPDDRTLISLVAALRAVG